MSSNAGATGEQTTPRGLATLAMLKTRYDEGRDHLSLFEPFVQDAAARLIQTDFVVADIRSAIERDHGISLPSDTLKTLLGRFVTAKSLRRDAGRYFKTADLKPLDLVSARREQDRRQALLGDAFRGFASSRGFEFVSGADALSQIIAFLGEYHVPLALSGDLATWTASREKPLPRAHRLVAAFITEECGRSRVSPRSS